MIVITGNGNGDTMSRIFNADAATLAYFALFLQKEAMIAGGMITEEGEQ